MLALFPLGALQLPGLAVRQQEEVLLRPEDEEELSLVPAGGRYHNV